MGPKFLELYSTSKTEEITFSNNTLLAIRCIAAAYTNSRYIFCRNVANNWSVNVPAIESVVSESYTETNESTSAYETVNRVYVCSWLMITW